MSDEQERFEDENEEGASTLGLHTDTLLSTVRFLTEKLAPPDELATLIRDSGMERALDRSDADGAYDGTEEDACELACRLGALRKRMRQLFRDAEDSLIYYCLVTGKDIVIGDVRFYAGIQRRTCCVDVKATLNAVLETLEGDLDGMAALLSASAWKPAATKQALGDRAKDLFVETVVPDLKTGKPKRVLNRTNRRFGGVGGS